ncbi:predicted GPI-anchored protein 58 [Miscanthus floridulus]|uniref:predicted GPI-anchored protein 58 n=1 Tax=Miscanthus floridulus TaxID=154761 RepID=UPI0034588E16
MRPSNSRLASPATPPAAQPSPAVALGPAAARLGVASPAAAAPPRLRPHQATARTQPLTPGPHLSAPSPTPRSSATARARRLSNRRPRSVHRGSAPLAPRPLQIGAEPPLARPLLPPLQFLPRSWPQPPHGEAPPAADLTSSRAAVPEPSSPPFFPAVRTPSSPLSPHATYFPFCRP